MSDLGNKEVFAKNLNHYMKINNVDRNKLCNDLDFNYTTVREWTNGTAYPRIDKIEMLANYFDIMKSDLIEDKKGKELDEMEILFSKNKDILTDDDKETIRFIIEKARKKVDEQLDGKDESS